MWRDYFSQETRDRLKLCIKNSKVFFYLPPNLSHFFFINLTNLIQILLLLLIHVAFNAINFITIIKTSN